MTAEDTPARDGCEVAILIRSLAIGGAERQASLLARAWHAAGIAVVVITFYPVGDLMEELVLDGVPVESAGKRARWDVVGFGRRLAAILRRRRPRVLYTFMPGANLTGVVLKRLRLVEVLAWGIRASDMRLGHTSAFLRAVARLEVLGARYADVIIGNSEAGRSAHIAQGFPAARFAVIPNAIDAARFRFDPHGRVALRGRLGIPSATVLVGHVARFDPMKDHPTFIRAAAALRGAGIDAHFLCVGTGDRAYFERLARLVHELGLANCFHWLQDVKDPVQAYAAMDVFVSSSAYGEGFSNVIGEAMACGLPCVVTAVGDASRIVTPEDAVVPPGDPDMLAVALGRLCAAARPAREDTAGRRRILQEFSPARLAMRTAELLGVRVPAAGGAQT